MKSSIESQDDLQRIGVFLFLCLFCTYPEYRNYLLCRIRRPYIESCFELSVLTVSVSFFFTDLTSIGGKSGLLLFISSKMGVKIIFENGDGFLIFFWNNIKTSKSEGLYQLKNHIPAIFTSVASNTLVREMWLLKLSVDDNRYPSFDKYFNIPLSPFIKEKVNQSSWSLRQEHQWQKNYIESIHGCQNFLIILLYPL